MHNKKWGERSEPVGERVQKEETRRPVRAVRRAAPPAGALAAAAAGRRGFPASCSG